MLEFAENARKKLGLITNADARTAELETERQSLLNTLADLAAELSAKRTAAAKLISQGVEKELDDLRMPSAKFEVTMDRVPAEDGLADRNGGTWAFGDNGYDRVEFLISPNPGEGLKPLAKVASGGETSRVMLALKNTLAKADTIPTMVFDEIDQGIGGRVGALVGEKLWELGQYHQVICITHLPQLAALRDAHFHVRKQIEDGRTQTVVTPLTEDESLREMAALLGSDSEENEQAVTAMLKEAEQFKKSYRQR